MSLVMNLFFVYGCIWMYLVFCICIGMDIEIALNCSIHLNLTRPDISKIRHSNKLTISQE